MWFVVLALGLPEAVLGTNPSLCLTEPTGCDVPGSTVNLEVQLGPCDDLIVGVQFQLSYDPNSLTSLEVLPGSSCDVNSPFSLEIYRDIDEPIGSIFYAVGINPFKGDTGTNQGATVACVRFLPRGVSLSEISILVGTEPLITRLSDSIGHAVFVDNTLTCFTGVVDILATREAMVEEVCECADDSDCITINSACRLGTCDSSSTLCVITPINEGAGCDDGNDCTTIDRCAAGLCVGSGCTNQSLCLGEACAPLDSLMVVPVLLGEGDPVITGGQFSIQWNTGGLELVDARPGSFCDSNSPFSVEVQRVTDAVNGDIFYAVGLPLGGEGTSGPATMACMFFRVLNSEMADVCLFEDIVPNLTKLVDDQGRLLDYYNAGACSSEAGFPMIDCKRGAHCIIPTTSEWGFVALALAFLIYAKVTFRQRGDAI
jgi:hypothetical protein